MSFPNTITGYNYLHSDSETKSGEVGIYTDSSISYQIQTDIPNALNDSESLWIEINLHKKPCIIGVYIDTQDMTLVHLLKIYVKFFTISVTKSYHLSYVGTST